MKARQVLVCAMLFSAVAVFASPANAVTLGSSEPPEQENCIIVLDGLQPGVTDSRILHQECSTDPTDLVAPSTHHTLLMTWYADANYQGAHTDIYGWFGTCDQQGYGIPYVGDVWNERISSWVLWGRCYYTTVWEDPNYTGDYDLFINHVRYTGDGWNDRISSMKIRST